MVKIRLRRVGAKGRPYYRVVVAPSTAGRNGRFVETIGTYDPVSQPKKVEINEERALHWLNQGAQPSETTAYLLNKTGILPKYLEARPEKKKEFKFLDKRTAAISKPSAVDTAQPPAKAAKAEPAPIAEAEPAEIAEAVEAEAAVEEPTAAAEPEVEAQEAAPEAEKEGTEE